MAVAGVGAETMLICMGGTAQYGACPSIYLGPDRPLSMTDGLGGGGDNENNSNNLVTHARDNQHMDVGSLDSTNRGNNFTVY